MRYHDNWPTELQRWNIVENPELVREGDCGEGNSKERLKIEDVNRI